MREITEEAPKPSKNKNVYQPILEDMEGGYSRIEDATRPESKS